MATGDDSQTQFSQGSQPIVLLVDDEPALLKLMAISLRRHGWRVHVAPDAETALAMADQLRFQLNLLITDIDMPGMPGDELILRIRKWCPLIEVLAISGAIPESSQGFSNIQLLKKPFSMRALNEAARELLSKQF